MLQHPKRARLLIDGAVVTAVGDGGTRPYCSGQGAAQPSRSARTVRGSTRPRRHSGGGRNPLSLIERWLPPRRALGLVKAHLPRLEMCLFLDGLQGTGLRAVPSTPSCRSHERKFDSQ
jgi:hypothetical protein